MLTIDAESIARGPRTGTRKTSYRAFVTRGQGVYNCTSRPSAIYVSEADESYRTPSSVQRQTSHSWPRPVYLPASVDGLSVGGTWTKPSEVYVLGSDLVQGSSSVHSARCSWMGVVQDVPLAFFMTRSHRIRALAIHISRTYRSPSNTSSTQSTLCDTCARITETTLEHSAGVPSGIHHFQRHKGTRFNAAIALDQSIERYKNILITWGRGMTVSLLHERPSRCASHLSTAMNIRSKTAGI